MLIISIILEAAITGIVIFIARDGRPYMYGLAIHSPSTSCMISPDCCDGMSRDRCYPDCSLIATVCALAAVWGLYRDRPR